MVGKGKPVAWALDGYPVYGLTEPDGSPVRPLDACHGHDDPVIGYHYHAATKYPYLIGAFHGEVTERDGQVVCACGGELQRTDSPAVAIVRHRRREKRKVDMR